MGSIAINHEEYFTLKTAYENAIRNKEVQFEYKGNEILVSYAKYVLEHMRNVLSIKK